MDPTGIVVDERLQVISQSLLSTTQVITKDVGHFLIVLLPDTASIL